MTLLADLLSTVFERRYRQPARKWQDNRPLDELAGDLVGSAGETSGLALAQNILSGFDLLDDERKLAFFQSIATSLSIDPVTIRKALDVYEHEPSK
ncbi:MAG: decarboxylase, partial [Roseibium sp.]|nr:decarboxylase [Roseibium sp.]